jgi:hypothetical protein
MHFNFSVVTIFFEGGVKMQYANCNRFLNFFSFESIKTNLTDKLLATPNQDECQRATRANALHTSWFESITLFEFLGAPYMGYTNEQSPLGWSLEFLYVSKPSW